MKLQKTLTATDRMNLEARLIKRREIDESGCWLWTGRRNPKGYGQFENTLTHRVSAAVYLDFDLSSKLRVLHTCDVPPCFNPSHLFVGTDADNARDRMLKGRNGDLRGERHGRAVLTEGNVREIRARAGTVSQEVLAREYGVKQAAISRAIRRVTWPHIE